MVPAVLSAVNMSNDNDRSLRHLCRQLLGNFFRSLGNLEPWWVSIVHPVEGDETTTLTSLLGFEHDVGLQFLCSAGLLKPGPKKSYSVLIEQWDLFIVQEKLQEIMETVNKSSISQRFFFINYGNRRALFHKPIDQFKGKAKRTKRFDISARQWKLHAKIGEMMLELCSSDSWRNPEKSVEQLIEDNDEAPLNSADEGKESGLIGSMAEWFEDTVLLDKKRHPNLWELYKEEEKVALPKIKSLFYELLTIIGTKSNAVDFSYLNDRKGRAVVVPQVKSLPAFMEQARRLKWIDSILEHVAGPGYDVDDSAEWLCFYLGKKYEASYTLASESLGNPLVQQMSETKAEAMWADANVNVTQQRIIKRHLRHQFGKRLFIADRKLSYDCNYYSVPTRYGEYKYVKDGDTSQKPDKCSFWSRDASLVVQKELERLLDYTNLNEVTTKFNSLASNGCTLVTGADQGQGAWRSWVKISTMSSGEIRNAMASDDNFDPKKCYLVQQVAHIVCKKDHHQILSETVSADLSTAYETLQASSLVFLREPEESKIKSYYIPKHAHNLCIEEDGDGCTLSYNLQADHGNGFSMKYNHSKTLKKGSSIVLIIPHFDLYVTGDLSYYADVLGMPNSSSYWCPWCLLSRIQWQQSADNVGEKRTREFLNQTFDAITNDAQKRLQPTDKKGVSCALHYKSLGPENFVPPLLHMEMGMVNQVWEHLEEWIDDKVENVPPDEKAARLSLLDAQECLERATREKEVAKITVSVEIRQKKGEVKTLQRERKRKDIANDVKVELDARITLLQAIIKEQEGLEKRINDSFKDAQGLVKSSKKKIEDLKSARGKPESSISADLELTLANYTVSRAAYHGGEFNGVCCRRIVQSAKPICDEIRHILLSKRDQGCDEMEIKKK